MSKKSKSKLEFDAKSKVDKFINSENPYDEKLDRETIERINEVYEVETRVAIIFAIENFGSSNIKKLAKILSMNEATIYHHLKSLTKEPALIKLDESMTLNNKGKFYQLTEFAIKNFGSPSNDESEKSEEASKQMKEILNTILEKTDIQISEIYMDMLRKHPNKLAQADAERKNLAYNHILEKLYLSNLENAAKAFDIGKKPMNMIYPMGSIINTNLGMKIAKTRHIIEILIFFEEMSSKFYSLKRKIAKEMDNQKIPEKERINVRYHFVGGEVDTFEFE